jgi:hypothetical protein
MEESLKKVDDRRDDENENGQNKDEVNMTIFDVIAT